jgi:hypothetical protein
LCWRAGFTRENVMVGRASRGGLEADFLPLREQACEKKPGNVLLTFRRGEPGDGRISPGATVPQVYSEAMLADVLAGVYAGPWDVSVVRVLHRDLGCMEVLSEVALDLALLRAQDNADRALGKLKQTAAGRRRGRRGDTRGARAGKRRRTAAAVAGEAAESGDSRSGESTDDSAASDDWPDLRVSSEGESDGGAAVDEPPASAPVAAAPGPAAAPGSPEVVRHGWGLRSVDRYQAAQVLDSSTGTVLGRVLLNTHPQAMSLDGHCQRCGCRVNRRFLGRKGVRPGSHPQGRPLGALVAWLRRPCEGDQQGHRALWTAEELSLERRQEARQWAEGRVDFAALLERERAPGPGEPSEPLSLV